MRFAPDTQNRGQLRPGFRGRPRHVIHDALLLDVCICAIEVLHILLYVSCQLILHTRHLDPNKPSAKRNVTSRQSRKHSKPSISGRSLLPSAFAHFRLHFARIPARRERTQTTYFKPGSISGTTLLAISPGLPGESPKIIGG